MNIYQAVACIVIPILVVMALVAARTAFNADKFLESVSKKDHKNHVGHSA
jgi:hypothetical protein